MPIYEYVCDDCGHELEALQGLSEDPLTDCPECHEARLRRKISAAAFRLKGGGWYETDFKKDNKRNIAGEGKAENHDGGKTENNNASNADKPNAGGADGGSSGKANEGSGKQTDTASRAKSSESKGASGKAKTQSDKAQ
jgi:putative FmdB family regulatory protein